mmetsp:Transcript_26974/g.44035  ORF Transcript_26974/g.44035 Transcript_26974/m.44035 type:complete len:510 (+) Transcript_26974:107-1636(+)
MQGSAYNFVPDRVDTSDLPCCWNPQCDVREQITAEGKCSKCNWPRRIHGKFEEQFEIIRFLGKGHFGRAFLCTDLGQNKKLCVVKQLTHLRKTFLRREAAVLKLCDHPLIPRVFDLLENEYGMFLVESLVNGRDLLSLRRQQYQFKEVDVLGILQDVLYTLDYLHNKGVMHRDISPGNIIQSTESRYCLIDFGLAVIVTALAQMIEEFAGEAIQDTFAAEEHEYVGTIFSAPEQLKKNEASPVSDLYSLGATCMFALDGRSGGFGDWSHDPLKLRRELFDILTSLVRPIPTDRRFKSASELLVELRKLFTSAPPQPTPTRQQNTPSASPTTISATSQLELIGTHRTGTKLYLQLCIRPPCPDFLSSTNEAFSLVVRIAGGGLYKDVSSGVALSRGPEGCYLLDILAPLDLPCRAYAVEVMAGNWFVSTGRELVFPKVCFLDDKLATVSPVLTNDHIAYTTSHTHNTNTNTHNNNSGRIVPPPASASPVPVDVYCRLETAPLSLSGLSLR